MMITTLFDAPFYTGEGTSNEVPGKYDCAINGIPFMLDNKHQTFKGGISSIPLIRSQVDQGTEPGENSTNSEDLWPRSQHSFHHGAGQQWLDDTSQADRFRFWNSRGIDPWTRGQIKTLGGTSLVLASASTNLALETAGDYLYMADGNTLRYFADASTSTTNVAVSTATSETASPIKSLASDGKTVYFAVTDGVHSTLRGTGTATHYNSLAADLLGWAKGRLMASVGTALYNITSGSTPTALFTHPTSDWTWTCFAEGTACIYAAGYSGDKSVIYSITIKDDGTGLNVPKVAGELPDGEIVRSMQGYLGYLNIGTDKGLRTAEQDANNYLTIGALIAQANPVLCFEPQDRFVWYGWSNFDSSFTGLGRMDLSQFTDNSVPAYASDLMYGSAVTGFGVQGSVVDIATTHSKRVFVISGIGLVREQDQPTTFDLPYFETSEITFGVPDNKVALKLAVEHEALVANQYVEAYISVDSGAYQLIQRNNIVGSRHPSEPFSVDQATGSTFRLKFVLYREGTTPTTLNRFTLRAYPIPTRGSTITVPLLLHENFIDANGKEEHLDPVSTQEYVRNLAALGNVVRYQELGTAYSVFIDDTQFERYSRTQKGTGWNGTLACKLKVLGD